MSALRPDVSRWEAWRPEQVAALLAGVEVPWYVAGGWALDLFAGEERREHEDLEIAVPGERFHELAAALDGLEPFVITAPGEAVPLELARERLGETHQTWIREPATGLWRFDVLREPADAGTWIYRRDRRLRMPYARLIERTDAGIPYARPEVILLFKAKHSERDRDRRDFDEIAPLLEPDRRRWLAEVLELVHPGHPWLGRL